MKKILSDFCENIRQNKNLSENTLLSYRRDIEHFADYYGGNLIKAKPSDFKEYFEEMRAGGKANSTLARSMASLRSFYSFLAESGKISDSPLEDFKTPRIEKKLPVVLTAEEVEKLLAQPEPTGFKGKRDKAMLELLYATGIKVSELVDLNISAVNLKRKMLVCTKNDSARVVPMGKEAVSAVKAYINGARNQCLSDKREQALFINSGGKRMTRQGFWKALKKYKESAGIDKEITPHMLRHSFAAHLLENGADLVSIGEMMGLTDAASTAVYQKIMENKIFEVYNKAHPRA